MQYIGGSRTKPRRVLSRQLARFFERLLGKGLQAVQAAAQIAIKRGSRCGCLLPPCVFAKHAQFQSVYEFNLAQCRKHVLARRIPHDTRGGGRVSIRVVEGN